MERIVSLIPSSTEITCALGFGDALVGRSHECDFPPEVERLPALTEPKLDTRAASAAIDGRVKQLVAEGLSVYRVDVDKLRELRPTLILTQDQCEVCAASLGDVEEALSDWLGEPPRVVSLHPNRLGDVWGDFERVATALGEAARGREFAASLSKRLAEISEQTLRIRARPSVACVEWIDPLMAAGNWIPELVTLAGGRPLFGEAGAHSPWLDWDAMREADPEIAVLIPCGFDIERTRQEIGPLIAQPGWSDLQAVRTGRVFVADGNQYFNRPGPRLLESLEILAEILHPDHFAPRHESTGWQVL
jgi:iron complex transport system substrate-binding protein